MLKSTQEGYRTLRWIRKKSVQGLYPAVADETMQADIYGCQLSPCHTG